MITLGIEPEGMLVKRADVLAWLPGLSREQWRKIRPSLREIYVPGGAGQAYAGQRPHYSKSEIKAKLIAPVLQQSSGA